MPPLYRVGDHLRVSRPRSIFIHEGIYAHDGWVIHVEKGGVVEYIPLAVFRAGGVVEVIRQATDQWEGEAIVARAELRLGQPYDAFRFNCQHLVHEAITGQASSPAINALVTVSLFVGVGVVVRAASR